MSRTRDRTYKANRERVLANSDTCWLCGGYIDPSLKFPDPLSKSADHVIPISQGGHNHGELRPAHLGCNKSRGRKLPPTTHARRW